MAVLGILAGVVIFSINSWRTHVAENEVRSDLSGVGAGMNSARNFGNSFPLGLPSTFTASTNVQLTYVSGDATAYCIDGKSKVIPSVTYFIDTVRTAGEIKHGTCALGETPEGYDPSGPGWNNAIASGGGGHKCGIAAGKAYCWGTNNKGQLGNNTMVASNTPVAVNTAGALSGKTVTSIAVGAESTCAIADGAVYCWGNNVNLQSGWNVLGADLPPMQQSSIPLAMNTIQPGGLLIGKTVTAIAGNAHTYCVIANGAIYCWGANFYGQLGVGNTSYYTAPVAVSTAGVLSGKSPTALASTGDAMCAIASGKAYCWGSGQYGMLGNGAGSSTSPVAVSTAGVLNGKTVTAISGGYYNFCVIADGAAYCWGYNVNGQLGNGTSVDSNIPVAVSTAGVLSGKTITAITAGGHACAVATGNVYCWGGNSVGQLGNGTTTPSNVPVAVTMSGALSGKTVTSIAAGHSSMCATVMATSEGFCWGLGPIGNGPAGNVSSAVKVTAP
jgi:alpha-tubulin suppressor-like RCC1 family protein